MPDPFDFADDDILPQSDRLQILSPEEYELLWGSPRFSLADRDLFFSLNRRDEQTLARLRTPRTKLDFLLQLAYFRARQRFFRLDVESASDDLAYLSRHYLGGAITADLEISKHTRRRHIELILDLFGYRMADQSVRLTLEERALAAARISSRPVYVLRDLIDHLRYQRIVLPGYTYLQDVVRRALSFERTRLSEALGQFITTADAAMLDALLSNDDGLHAVTAINHHPRDFSHKQLLAEIERGVQIRDLFVVAKRVIAQAGLSAESVRFYASLVAYTLLASHVPLNARIIGANEHESHYVFDVLFINFTDIQPATHSTDTHGTNQVNFALLHLFDSRFAPRYRDFRSKV